MKPAVTHQGAVTGVIGSCHQYTQGNNHYLIDCGLFQGGEAARPLNGVDFNPDAVDAIIVTHSFPYQPCWAHSLAHRRGI